MTDTVGVPEGDTAERGRWKRVVVDGKPTAVLSCPGCGLYGYLDQHEIAADGTVTPSVECPNGCGFHRHIRLESWSP